MMSRADADSWIEDNKLDVEAGQYEAFNTKGHYHQCLDSHSVIPDAKIKPDLYLAKTSDTDEGWSNFPRPVVTAAGTIGASVLIFVYHKEGERGWVLGVKAREGTVEYIKTFGYGPEAAARTREWTLLPQEPAALKQSAPRKTKG